MPSLNHVHTYERSKLNKRTYRCVGDPLCTHFARRELLLGKLAKCPECERDIILTPKLLDLARVVCDDCRKETRPAKRLKKTVPMLEELFAPPGEKTETDEIMAALKLLEQTGTDK